MAFCLSHKLRFASWQSLPSRLRSLVKPLVLTCHGKPLKRIITCAVVSFNVFVVCADNSCRITSHVQERLSFCIVFFALFALRYFVDDYELGDVNVSLLTVQLRCASVPLS